ISNAPQYEGNLGELDTSYRILADHARMLTVAISDGLLPSNDNLGHKLRSILHRCIHLSRAMFHTEPHLLLPALVNATVTSLVTVIHLWGIQDKTRP
ncbi:alanine--tRNA ligase, partial [Elysia marginata]